MYQLIAIKKEDEFKQVKAFWVVNTYITLKGATKAQVKMNNKYNSHIFKVVEAA